MKVTIAAQPSAYFWSLTVSIGTWNAANPRATGLWS
jgi:hypothetical protein